MEKIIIDKEEKTITIKGLHLVSKDVNFTNIIVLDDNDDVIYLTINKYGDYGIRYTGIKLDKFLLDNFKFYSTKTYSIQ